MNSVLPFCFIYINTQTQVLPSGKFLTKYVALVWIEVGQPSASISLSCIPKYHTINLSICVSELSGWHSGRDTDQRDCISRFYSTTIDRYRSSTAITPELYRFKVYSVYCTPVLVPLTLYSQKHWRVLRINLGQHSEILASIPIQKLSWLTWNNWM